MGVFSKVGAARLGGIVRTARPAVLRLVPRWTWVFALALSLLAARCASMRVPVVPTVGEATRSLTKKSIGLVFLWGAKGSQEVRAQRVASEAQQTALHGLKEKGYEPLSLLLGRFPHRIWWSPSSFTEDLTRMGVFRDARSRNVTPVLVVLVLFNEVAPMAIIGGLTYQGKCCVLIPMTRVFLFGADGSLVAANYMPFVTRSYEVGEPIAGGKEIPYRVLPDEECSKGVADIILSHVSPFRGGSG